MEIVLDAPRKIMILDDEPNFCRLMAGQLKFQGFDTIFFTRGDFALRFLETQLVDILLMDVHLPGSSGLELLEKVRETPWGGDLAVIITSADSNRETVQEYLARNVIGYLLKPFPFSKLLELVNGLEVETARRRESMFMQQLLSQPPTEGDTSLGVNPILQANFQRSELVRSFLHDPSQYNAEQRIRLGRAIQPHFRDLERILLENAQSMDESSTLITLELIEALGGVRSMSMPLFNLVSGANAQIASKAVKLLGQSAATDVSYFNRFLGHQDSRFIANLLEALWHSGNDDVADVFKRYALDLHPRVRANSLVGMILHGGRELGLQRLGEMLESDRTDWIRSALWAVRHLGLNEMNPHLERLASRGDDGLAAKARTVLREMKSAQPPPPE